MATQTFRDFMTECECYEYSTEYYEMLKESYEISLMEQYIANQQFVLENTDLINSNTFTESTFVESSSIDANQIELLTEEVEKKKESLLKRAWERLKKVLQGVLSFFKRILGLNKKIEEQTKEVARKWKVKGGLDGVVKHIIKKAKDKIDEDSSKETDKETSKDSDKSNKEEDPDYMHNSSKLNELQREFYNTISLGSLVTIEDYKILNDETKNKIWNFIHQKVLKSSGSASEFFDPSSSRDIVYEITPLDKNFDIKEKWGYKLKVIKHKPNSSLILFDSAYGSEGYLNKDYIGEFINKSNEIINQSKPFAIYIQTYTEETLNKNINEIIDSINKKIESLSEFSRNHPKSNYVSDAKLDISNLEKVNKGLVEYQLLYQAVLRYQQTFNKIADELTE